MKILHSTGKKRVLISGATGFSGSYLSDLLSQDPSLELYRSDSSITENTPGFIFCNFCDPSAVEHLIALIRPDAIYHLIGSYTNQFDIDFASNVASTKNILTALLRKNIQSRVLIIGSSAEYGLPDNPEEGVVETHSLAPVSIYGLVKLFQTKLMEAYVRLYEMDILAVRPFNLFGQGLSQLLFVGKMQKEIERYKKREIREIITGNLSIERDYIDIEEAIQYYRRVMEKGKAGEVYNVGSGRATSLRNILQGMLKRDGLGMEMVREGTHEIPGKIVVPKIFADITKIQSL